MPALLTSKWNVAACGGGANFSETGKCFKTVNITKDGAFVTREYTTEEYQEGLRTMYLPVEHIMENTLVADSGFSCDSADTAVPECFDGSGWSRGAFGNIFKMVTDELGVPIVAMTRANFSDLVVDVYKVPAALLQSSPPKRHELCMLPARRRRTRKRVRES